MYARALEGTWEVFGGYLSGASEGLIAVVGTSFLGPQAQDALQSSFARLGFGQAAGTFFTLEGNGGPDWPESNAETPRLSEKEVFAAIEGLDPLFLVIADAAAAKACASAYRQEIPLDQRCRVLGREVRAFTDFTAMLSSQSGKQAAWGLLKTLPKGPGA